MFEQDKNLWGQEQFSAIGLSSAAIKHTRGVQVGATGLPEMAQLAVVLSISNLLRETEERRSGRSADILWGPAAIDGSEGIPLPWSAEPTAWPATINSALPSPTHPLDW